jgi:putative FmdB family regulatory protein
MPTYEYVCQKCGHQFEKFQSMAARPLVSCPADLCARKPWGRGKVKKVISAGAGLIFKGSGFYITDYRSEKYKEAAKKEAGGGGSGGETKSAQTGSGAGTETKSTGGSESKPAVAPATPAPKNAKPAKPAKPSSGGSS